jgi:5-methyltetrahydrofolate--homocysteine methyltransferase
MIIIGEKINGSIPQTSEAIKNGDREYIENLIKMQEECGVNYLDICAGTAPEEEYDTLIWLLDIVQAVSRLPLCLDSPNPLLLRDLIERVEKPGIINSVSGEGDKCEVLFPVLRDNPEWQAIALCCDNDGIAESVEDKTRIAFKIIREAEEYAINSERIHIDPLVLAVSAVHDSALSFCKAMDGIKEKYPSVKITAALSNVSFGMPLRRVVNRGFLSMTMAHGLDSGILDPTNKDIMETIYSMEALLGKDCFGRKFNKAYRSGKIGHRITKAL